MGNGYKYDAGKTRYDLVPVEIEEQLAKALTYGASKYPDDNWKTVEEKKYYSALRRHLAASMKGEQFDPESGLSHLTHALANVAFLLYNELQNDKINAITDTANIERLGSNSGLSKL